MESNKAIASKVIRISQEQYDKLLSLGSMNMSFSDVLDNVMKQAKLIGVSAASKDK